MKDINSHEPSKALIEELDYRHNQLKEVRDQLKKANEEMKIYKLNNHARMVLGARGIMREKTFKDS